MEEENELNELIENEIEDEDICHMCQENNLGDDIGDYTDPDGRGICSKCFVSNFFTCQVCGDVKPVSLRRNYITRSGRTIITCETCFGDIRECSGCGRIFGRESLLDVGLGNLLCMSCAGSMVRNPHGENLIRPRLDTESKIFQSEDFGKIITDDRMFSAEIECYPPNTSSYEKVIKTIPKDFFGTGQVSDASLDSGGIEFQTPILQGKKGEQYFKDFCKMLSDNGFFVNTKAGLHIHLDGKGFTTKSLFKKMEIINHVSQFLFSLNRQDKSYQRGLNHLRKFTRFGDRRDKTDYPSGELNTVSDIFGAKYFGDQDVIDQREDSDKQYLKLKNSPLPEEKYIEEVEKAQGQLISMLSSTEISGFEGYMEERYSSRLLPRIKQLFTVYYFADDFIMQVLPHSRRNNKYCLPLWKEFNIAEIDRLERMSQFEKMWYQMDDIHDIKYRKGDPKDSSRRHGANFHILMCRGHFELRYHSGTINADKILYWVQLNQALMNLALDDEDFGNIRAKLEGVRFIQNLKLRRQHFYKLLKLPKDAVEYWESRANKFTDEDELKPVVKQNGNNQDL